jgi:hypothetical protein
MVWFRADDTLAFNAAVVRAGNAAMGLWVRAGTWCAQQLTDGHVPRHIADTLGSPAQIRRLVDTGLWHETETGFLFHEWNATNPTRSQVENRRQSEAKKKSAFRQRRAGREGLSTGESPGVSTGESPGVSTGDLTVTRPDPTRPDLQEEEQPPSLRSGTPRRKGARIPDDYAPTDDLRAWARRRGFTDPQLDEITEQFVRYWQAKAGRDASKLHWGKAWQNWICKENPARVQMPLPAPNGHRTWTTDDLNAILGPDYWQPPPTPDGMTPDDMWQWDQDIRSAHRADRIAAAETKLNGKRP